MKAAQSRAGGKPDLRRVRAEMERATVRTLENPTPISRAEGQPDFVASPGALPAGSRIYAIGDIHGQAEKLRALHRAVAEDMRRRPIAAARVIYLGDYIDWGPDSAGVLEMLAGGEATIPAIHLIGDHEQMLLDALDGDNAAATDWLHSGGRETLTGWGIDPDAPRDRWAAQIPPAQLNFLRRLVLRHRAGNYLFVHAGIRPGVKSAEQTRQDLLGIREPFLSTPRGLGRVVVHGHTISAGPVIRFNRIGVDTGAGLGGNLTAAILEAGQVGFICF